MELGRYIQARNWPIVAGYMLFIGMMAVGYFYNVTFVQLGLKDFGERVLGLPAVMVAQQMAVLALLTGLVAVVTGYGWWRWGKGGRFLAKLQWLLVVVVVQTVLTAVLPLVGSPAGSRQQHNTPQPDHPGNHGH
jgi:MFS superfamily sulfate permease-like transporter